MLDRAGQCCADMKQEKRKGYPEKGADYHGVTAFGNARISLIKMAQASLHPRHRIRVMATIFSLFPRE